MKKVEVSIKIAVNYAEIGEFSKALEAAKEMKIGWWKAEALNEIAGKYAEAG